MITGFNTDIEHNGRVYHIQTEDKGLQNPCIESLVYVGGEILASKKTSYADHLAGGADEKFISSLMEQQHRTMIAAIKRGRFDQAEEKGEATRGVGSSGESSEVMYSGGEERTLDQVIIDYLASEAESEHLELSLASSCDFISGQPAEFRVSARKSLSQQPVGGANVEVKVISTVDPPQILFRGRTSADGTTTVRCTIPQFSNGTAAVIVSAQSALGNDEFKQLVKRRR